MSICSKCKMVLVENLQEVLLKHSKHTSNDWTELPLIVYNTLYRCAREIIKNSAREQNNNCLIFFNIMENTKTILVVEIVEDDPSLENAIADKLHHEGFSVLEAKDGKEGLEMALQKHPDLILLDIKMPVMDGIEMLKVLRTDDWGKKVPVIVLSNLSDNATIAEAIDRSTFEYFVKADIKLKEVIDKIKEKLNISHVS